MSITPSELKEVMIFIINNHHTLGHSQSSVSPAVFDPIFPDTCYHLTHYWYAAADIPVASDNPAH
ncbi:MAG: hypothetical protein E7I42_26175, partial [Pluralibacter gergoviae]|nr:hypothetical protein [Pluralibacter gergoviae]